MGLVKAPYLTFWVLDVLYLSIQGFLSNSVNSSIYPSGPIDVSGIIDSHVNGTFLYLLFNSRQAWVLSIHTPRFNISPSQTNSLFWDLSESTYLPSPFGVIYYHIDSL